MNNSFYAMYVNFSTYKVNLHINYIYLHTTHIQLIFWFLKHRRGAAKAPSISYFSIIIILTKFLLVLKKIIIKQENNTK